MGTRRPWRSAQEWEGLVREFDAGNETLRKFCDRKELGMSTFRKWRQRHSPSYRPRATLHGSGFVEVTPGIAPMSAITLQVGQGLRIECPQGMSVEAIAQLARCLVDGR